MTGLPPPTTNQMIAAVRDIIDLVDERAADCNRKWGYNRLPLLVPIEWMEKFRSQKRKWEAACFEFAGSPLPDDLEQVRKQGNAMLRAFDKLEALAVEQGHMPTPPAHWEFELNDGTPVILVRERHQIAQVDPKGRPVQIWALEEVADVIAKFPVMVLGTKSAFPGAELVQCRTSKPLVDALDDSLTDLPF